MAHVILVVRQTYKFSKNLIGLTRTFEFTFLHKNPPHMRLCHLFLYAFLMVFMASSCGEQAAKAPVPKDALFTELSSKETGIEFLNQLQHTEEFNAYTYRNFYNGAGVGIGDINNDGLPDIYFCGNQADNKLYLNKGNFQFEDITEKAGVACKGVWSSGVSFADVNGDGLLDIYAVSYTHLTLPTSDLV